MKSNISNRPFQINLSNITEVRMGSPYNYCDVELIGTDKIILPKVGWQDKYAWSTDSKRLVLIYWDFENNEPGFRLFIIDTQTGKTTESQRISGLPRGITIDGNKIKYKKFLFDEEKSATGKLCCEVEEEYELSK